MSLINGVSTKIAHRTDLSIPGAYLALIFEDSEPTPAPLPKENPYYSYVNSIRLENIAKNTKNETERELTMYPVPPKYEKIYQQSPKNKFVKHAGTKKRQNRKFFKVNKRKNKTIKNNKTKRNYK